MSKENIFKFIILTSVLICGLSEAQEPLPNYKWCYPKSEIDFKNCLLTAENVIIHAFAYADNNYEGISYSIRNATDWAVNQNPLKKLVMIAYMGRSDRTDEELDRLFKEYGPNECLTLMIESYMLHDDEPPQIRMWTIANKYKEILTFQRDTNRDGIREYSLENFEMFYNSTLEITAPNKGIILDAALFGSAYLPDIEKYLINFNEFVFASRNNDSLGYMEFEKLGQRILTVLKFATVRLVLYDYVYDKLKPFIIPPTTTATTATTETTETNFTSEATETAISTETDDYDRENGSSDRIRLSFKLLVFLVFSSIIMIK